MADERPSTRTRRCKSFRNQGFISNGDRRSRDRQRASQFPRGGKPLSGSKAPVQNCLSDLTIYLAAQVISTNKTDVKSHGPAPVFLLGLEWQHCTKINVPSGRFGSEFGIPKRAERIPLKQLMPPSVRNLGMPELLAA